MTTLLAVCIYAAALLAANLSVAHWGPWVSPINGFVLIGLDLTLRDWLHPRLKPLHMGALIVATAVLTALLNPAAERVAAASAVAFLLAAFADWAAFSLLRGSWLFRANGSNVGGALIDSIAFPTLAWGVFLPHVIAGQFLAKVLGGAVWSIALARLQRGAR